MHSFSELYRIPPVARRDLRGHPVLQVARNLEVPKALRHWLLRAPSQKPRRMWDGPGSAVDKGGDRPGVWCIFNHSMSNGNELGSSASSGYITVSGSIPSDDFTNGCNNRWMFLSSFLSVSKTSK